MAMNVWELQMSISHLHAKYTSPVKSPSLKYLHNLHLLAPESGTCFPDLGTSVGMLAKLHSMAWE